jgi:hypothetical protein
MATSNTVFVSPGVYTSERDLSFVSQNVGVTTLGIVGETLQGPAFEPIFITNFDEFQLYFGTTEPEKFVNTQIPKYEAAYIAKAYLQQSNQLFVTRVLGLSGYDAGPSWSISTVANANCSTVDIDRQSPDSATTYTIRFSGTTGATSEIGFHGTIPGPMVGNFYAPYTKFNGGTSSIAEDLKSMLLGIMRNPATTSGNTTGYWGPISGSQYALSAATYVNENNFFGVDSLSSVTCNSGSYDSWLYSNFNITSGNDYSGYSFNAAVTSLSGNGIATVYGVAGAFSGTITGRYYSYSGDAYADYNNIIVSTLRSRGLANYSTDNGPVYQVSGTSNLIMSSCSGQYSGVTDSPFATFLLSGVTIDSTNFNFEVSLRPTNANFITKVLGDTNFGKPKTEVPIFAEEVYTTLLSYGYNMGYIRGLNCTLDVTTEARDLQSDSLGWYLEKYKEGVTPWFVSELRGNTVYQLFKCYTISDGNTANTLIKVSIANISFSNRTFDLIVRDFFDSDSNPVILEKFSNCTMDFDQNSYIAKRVGSSDGEYALNSKYITVEVNPDAPSDALPCGFEGYINREYPTKTPAFPVYKTKFYYPGETIFDPPFGNISGNNNNTTSSGDNVRRSYLGFSSQFGIDSDLLQYKGKQNPTGDFCNTYDTASDWTYLTRGFHMDSGATAITISSVYATSGQPAFDCGNGSFNSEPTSETNPYYRLFARKFTVAFQGGFDGWDIYTEKRTNGNRFVLGEAGYLKGACFTDRYPTASGEGLFKQITVGDNNVDWANTDYYAYLLGQQTFANPEAVNINVFVTPGIDYVNNEYLVNEAVSMVEFDRADSIYIVTTPDFNLLQPSTSMDNFTYPQDAVDLLETSEIDSNYTATYYPWVLTRDTVKNTQIYIPATAEVCKNLALTDNIAFPWFASAGYTRGLVNSIKARKKLTQEDRDTLYKGRINPIATFNDVGTVIWGNKTLQVRESALDRINVRRLLLQARKLISAVAVRLLFEQNDAVVRQQFLDAVNPILDSIRRDRGLYDFRVTVSNSPEDMDRNQLIGKIYVKPTRSLEFIDIEFLITPTGASFENI